MWESVDIYILAKLKRVILGIDEPARRTNVNCRGGRFRRLTIRSDPIAGQELDKVYVWYIRRQ